jgi:hypothetical protein
MQQISPWQSSGYRFSGKLGTQRQERVRKPIVAEDTAAAHAIQPIQPKDDDEEDQEPPHERTDILV